MSWNKDLVHCSVPTILEFLESLLDDGRSPSTMWVYVAAMSAEHALVDNHRGEPQAGVPLLKVTFFFRGCIPRSPQGLLHRISPWCRMPYACLHLNR